MMIVSVFGRGFGDSSMLGGSPYRRYGVTRMPESVASGTTSFASRRCNMESQSVLDRPQRRRARRFTRHLFEMIVVMMLGMCVLGAAFGGLHALVFGSGYAAAWRDHVVLAAFGMAFNMTVPMVLWMHYRGHSWERCGAMALAMNLLVMLYRKKEYSSPHPRAGHLHHRRWFAGAH